MMWASGKEDDVCGGAGRVKEMWMILRMGGAWGLHSACLLCLPSLAGALWPLNAPATRFRNVNT